MLHATVSREQYIDQIFDKPSLNAYSLIAAYPPLIVCQAGDGNEFGGYSVDFHQSEASNQWSNLDEIYLVPGTQLDVMLRGGPEQWGQDVDFFETVEILDDKHMHLENGAFVQQAPSNIGKSYKVSCQTLGNYKVVFSRGNLVGDEHPLPAIAKVEVSLACSFPSSITLIANEPVNAPAVIQSATEAERSPEKVRVAPVTVANNCTIRVAAVGIHKSRKAFANSSSLCLKWDLSGCDGLAYWSDADGLGKSGTSWERFLVLHDASGLCILHARVIGFCDTLIGHLSEKTLSLLEDVKNVLTDAIRLQLVSSLRVLPDSVLLFFSPDAKVNLSIAGGTCFLDAIVNDSRVVEVIQPPQSMQCSQLMLGARGLGSSLVTVYDTGVAPPLVASAVVQVADVDWMKIISGEEMSLMEGSTQSINILAGVHDGGAFDASQYVYMNIRVHIEDPILELLDKDDFSSPGDVEINASNFVIEAKHLGVTLLHVSARQQSGEEIQSQPVKVEVYVPPRISPDDIFLVPGASYVLTLQGGPTIGVLLEYASMDDEVATINKFSGQLSAISPGNTTILATVYGNGNDVICQAYSRIQVGIPSSVILSIQSEQLAVGHEMPIFPSIPEGNLFSFYELCKNYKWTIEDEKVLSFHRPQDSNAHRYEVPFPGDGEINRGYLDEKDYGFINVLFGRSAGRTNIAISFSCEFHSSGYLSKSMSYNVSASVWVISDPPLALGVPITWVLPPFYTTSNILPASHGLYNQWDSHSRKGTVTYPLLRSSDGKNEEMEQHAISIDRGRIRTTESKNLACIQAKDLTTGRIEVASCVRVAEVSQIRLTSEKVPFRVVDLAIGSEVELLISYCDALGIPFYKANDVVPFDADTNYPDTVAINHTRDGNGTLRLKALRHGRALVRISINSIPEKSDYMMISVGARLNPQDPVLHIGHHLNFSLIGSNDLVFGHWLSANESVLSIDMLTGGAKAVGEGVTQVIFKGPDVNLQTTVTVLKANFVLVDAPSETLTNVPFPMKGYNFSVKFRFEAPGHSKGVLYDCRVDPPFVGYAKPWSDLDTGNSYCLFFPFSPEHLVHSIPKSKAMGPEITVSISASLQDSNHVMGSATAFFIGGFSILEIIKLNFSSHFNKSTITVVGNTDVEIHWQNGDLMMVTPTRREDFGIGGCAEYEVRVLKPKKFVDKIIISLPSTGQRMDIDISYEPGETESSGTWSVALWTGLLGCLSVLILSVAAYFWFLDRPHSSDRPIAAAPSVTAPITPDRSGVIHDSVQSPRTPQPFVEYVRRTIDETPYYRREGRRRFNPQKTY